MKTVINQQQKPFLHQTFRQNVGQIVRCMKGLYIVHLSLSDRLMARSSCHLSQTSSGGLMVNYRAFNGSDSSTTVSLGTVLLMISYGSLPYKPSSIALC